MIPAMSGWAENVVVAGIDEAGYGPILGPLVASAAAFEVPREAWHLCLWKRLSKSVTNATTTRGRRIVIQDSKKVYHRKEGLGKLERSVLAVFGAWREHPGSFGQLLAHIHPEALASSREYVWYQDQEATLPRAADGGSVRIASAQLLRDMTAASMRVAGLMSEILPEGHYNRLVGLTQNKASALFGLVLKLIQRTADANPNRDLLILVDKQGGRGRYGDLLMRAFEDRKLRVLNESAEESEYELQGRLTKWRIRFSEGGDGKHMAIALASMLSKYVRELYMERFNSYWCAQVADLAPTAGYHEDGVRFLRDIEPHAKRLGIRREQLVRER